MATTQNQTEPLVNRQLSFEVALNKLASRIMPLCLRYSHEKAKICICRYVVTTMTNYKARNILLLSVQTVGYKIFSDLFPVYHMNI